MSFFSSPHRPRPARLLKAVPALGFVAAMLLASSWLEPFVATVHGQGKPAAANAAPDGPKWALTGTVQQLMRGVFFPNANMIFNVQTHDPADKKPVPDTGSG